VGGRSVGLLPVAPGRGGRPRCGGVQRAAAGSQPQQDHRRGAGAAAETHRRRGGAQRRPRHRAHPRDGGLVRTDQAGRLRHDRPVQPQPHPRDCFRPRPEQVGRCRPPHRRARSLPAGRADRGRTDRGDDACLLRRAGRGHRGVRLAGHEGAAPPGGPGAPPAGPDGDERPRTLRCGEVRPRAGSSALPRAARRHRRAVVGGSVHQRQGAAHVAPARPGGAVLPDGRLDGGDR